MKAHDLHVKALEEIEKGNYTDGLKLTDEAMIEYQREGNVTKFAEVQAVRFIAFKHLYRSTDFEFYMDLAVSASQSAVDIAYSSGESDAVAIPLFNLAKAQHEAEDYVHAAVTYRECLMEFKNNPGNPHNRVSTIADIKGHMCACDYKLGDESAYDRALQALDQLEKSTDASKYEKDVWISGAHLRIAEMLKDDDREKAKMHLEKAREIIDGNEELVLRREQLDELTSLL